jgi:hypothetical protein
MSEHNKIASVFVPRQGIFWGVDLMYVLGVVWRDV